MSDTTARDNSKATSRYLHVVRLRCPSCDWPHLKAYRSTQSGDGSITRHSRCKRCGQRLLIVVE